MNERLHPYFRFDSLVIGGANRMAATAARSVAESPGTGYNPLFVYADPGLGKTHLLMAIGHRALEIDSGLRVEYLTVDDFVEAFHAALAAGQGEVYRRNVAEADLLLLDDVQFLAHRREMQAELLRLTDLMQSGERQIVLASDRPPTDIEALDDRLIRRFAGGLVVDIGSPEYETRVAILQRRSQEREMPFEGDVIDAVARLRFGNVRELLGAFNRLVALQAVTDHPIGAAEALSFLGVTQPPGADPAPCPESEAASGPGAATAEQQASPEAEDEFGNFLSEVMATVSDQVESWRARIAEAVLRWEGEGFATGRLESLLDGESVEDPEIALQQYQTEVAELQALAAEAEQLGSGLAGSAVFRDPDQLEQARDLVEKARRGSEPPPGPTPIWRLEELVESGSNRLALQSARTVVEHPGDRYNPLVIVGGSGRGKTHLLHGIGNALTAAGHTVACLDGHNFVAEVIEAINRERIGVWRARYREVTALLLDDVHALADKDRSQEELYLLFNSLLDNERQMVFTSAVPLPDLTGMEARLLTRLEGGLVVELPPPDRDVRQEVALRLLRARLDLEDAELAGYLASRPVDSIRSLHGLVQRVVSAAEVKDLAPSAALAREVLEGPAIKGPGRAKVKASGVVGAAAGIKSGEKMIWTWPDVAGRVIEDWR